jgi:hypothetical protein
MPDRSTCKVLLIQTPFPQTGKFRKKCKKFVPKIVKEAVVTVVNTEKKAENKDEEISNVISLDAVDYSVALFAYHEYRTDHKGYNSVDDFADWCKKKKNKI